MFVGVFCKEKLMRDVGIGVVGLGRLGLVHAQNIVKRVKNGRLVAVCDMNEELARATAEELGGRWYTEIEDMLEDRDIDAVCIVTPTAYHVEPIEKTVEAGKPFFCEKPLASNLEDTVYLAGLIEDSGLLCQIGFNRRFDPEYMRAKEIIDSGEIGKPVYYEGISRDPFPPPLWACDPAKGGGLFIDMLLHDFDLARFLMGDEVDSVFANETNLVIDGGDINRFADNVTATLRFEGGALGNCHASMHAEYGYDIRHEVYGERGRIIVDTTSRLNVSLASREGGVCKPYTYHREDNIPHFMFRFGESYANEMGVFVDTVLNGGESLVTARDALEAFRISLAAVESAGRHELIRLGETKKGLG